jgi:hypothetical protein
MVEVHQFFRGTYFLNFQGKRYVKRQELDLLLAPFLLLFGRSLHPGDQGSTFPQNVGELALKYRTSHPRRYHSSWSPL